MSVGKSAVAVWRLLTVSERKRFLLLFIVMIVLALFEVAVLVAIQAYMNLITVSGEPTGMFADWLPDTSLRTRLSVFSAGLMILFLAKFIIAVGTYALLARTVSRQMVRFMNRTFKAYQFAPYVWHLGRHTSDIQRNVLVDARQISNGIAFPLLQLALNIILSLAVVGFIVVNLPPVLLAMVAVVAGLLLAAGNVANRVLQDAGSRLRKANGDLLKAVQEGLGAQTEARLLGTRDGFVRRFSRRAGECGAANRRAVFVQQIMPILLETIILTSLVLIISFIVITSDNVEAAFAQATVFSVAVFRLRQNLQKVVVAMNKISSASPSLPPLKQDLETLETVLAPEGARSKRVTRKGEGFSKLVFENIGFQFPGTHSQALSDVSFTLRRGEHVSMMGATGAGKSTFLGLFLGLIQPSRGEILLDGDPLAQVTDDWMKQIGYVPQHVFLTDDTIAANIALGQPQEDHDLARMKRAVECAQLADFLETLPDGLDFRVGERGGNLSGGQRQRVGIARALYREPSILVLDEATSALDRATQARVMQSIINLPQNPTVIAVTHNLDTLAHTDRLIILADGRLALDGPINEVMQDPLFRDLTNLQSVEGTV